MGEPREGLVEESNIFVKDVAFILRSLANPDAVKIFMEMKDGIESSTKAIKKLGLTQKKYYSRLRELISSGLVEKTEKGYKLTVLGEAIYKVGTYVFAILTNRDRLTLVSQLIKSEKLSQEEKNRILKSLNLGKAFFLMDDLYGIKKVVKIVDTYDELVKIVAECYEKAEEDIKMATRYTAFDVAKKAHDALVRGVKIDALDGDKSNISSKLQIMKLVFMHPRAVISFYELMNHPNVSLKFYYDLPYSFMIIDGKFGAVEIPDPLTNEFLFAIFFEDQNLCDKLNQIFNQMKEKAIEHPYKELADKFKKFKL